MDTPSAVVPPEDPAVGRAVTVLLEMYKENTNHGRHLETQRQLVTGFILTIAAAALGFLATLKFPRGACVGVGLVLMAFGLIGTAFSIVQYGKYTQNRERWGAARQRLAMLCPMATLEAIVSASRPSENPHHDTAYQKRIRPWLRVGNMPLHWLWTLLMIVVLVLGAVLVSKADKLSSWAPNCPEVPKCS